MIENALIYTGIMVTIGTLLLKIYNALMKWNYMTVEASFTTTITGIFGIILYFPMSLFLANQITGYMGYMTGVLLMLHITLALCDVTYVKDMLMEFFENVNKINGGKGL